MWRRLVSTGVLFAYITSLLVLAQPAPPGGGSPQPPPPPGYPGDSVVPANAPIYLPGGGGVSDTGGATYSLPLWLPEGPQRARPDLSIVYGGRTNGLLGVGFALGGLSAITPCNRTFASEGYADNPDFGKGELAEAGHPDSSPDAYCLDGAKLVPHEEPGFEPTTNDHVTGFHTEIESFEYILAHRDQPQDVQPSKFTVHQRDGGTRTYLPLYGYQLTNQDARSAVAVGSQKISVLYLLAETVDRHGNRVAYTYGSSDAQGGGEIAYRLERVDYSYAGPTPRRSMKLVYETRPDPIVHYFRGFKIVTRSRLSRIEAWAPDPTTTAKVWSYQLAYSASGDTGRSLLANVKLCDQFNACSWTRAFDWTSTAHGPGVTENVIPEMEFGPESMGFDQDQLDTFHDVTNHSNWLKPNDTRVILYDMDGDGDDDALYRTKRSFLHTDWVWWSGFLVGLDYIRMPGTIKVRISSETAPINLMGYDVTDYLEPAFSYPFTSDGSIAAYVNLGKSRVGDVDGDGRLDLMLARTQIQHTGTVQDVDEKNFDTWRYGFYTKYGRDWDHFFDKPYLLDNGNLDLVQMHGPVLRWDEKGGANLVHQPPFQRVLADVDGDGKVEAIDAVDQDIDVLAYPGVDWDDPYSYMGGAGFPYHGNVSSDGALAVFDHDWTCGNGAATVVDLDGDGRQDVLVAADTQSANPEIDPVTGSPSVYKRLTLSDPYLGTPPHGMAAVGGTSKLWAGDCGGDIPDLVFGDWNGDGLEDALYPPGSYGGNTTPLVRWNLGTGFGPAEAMLVDGPPGITALMEQKVPVGKQGQPVRWDRGTRVTDLDGDGRSDIIAVRQDNTQCVDPVINSPVTLPGFGCENKVVVYLSQGDHFKGSQIWSWSNGMATLTHGFTTAQVGDTNGDGAPDLVHVAGGQLRVLQLPWRQTPDLLAGVVDGSAAYALETFSYSRSWWGDAPRLEATQQQGMGPMPCAWPLTCPRHGFEVVREHKVFAGTRPDGTAMYHTDLHKFADAKVSLYGRGSLGFNSHHVWNRESGIGEERVFDNGTAVDPDPGPGGLFYPYAGNSTLDVRITPTTPVPDQATLALATPGPGLTDGASTPVRTVWSSSSFELRNDLSGHILTMLPHTTEVYDVDNFARPGISTATPSWGATTFVGNGSRTFTQAVYDAYGNPTDQKTEVFVGTGGSAVVTHHMVASYDNRLATWRLGLPTTMETESYDIDDTAHPSRIKTVTYTAIGDPETVTLDAKGPEYAGCVAGGQSPALCLEHSTTTTLAYDSLGNVIERRVQAFDDPTTRVTKVSWDAEGVYPAVTTDPLGFQTTTLIHPALGVPVQMTDQVGNTTTATYDGFGRLRGATSPGMSSLTRSYAQVVAGSRRGIRVDSVRGDGRNTFRTTDELGRTIETGRVGFGGQWIHGQRELDVLGNLARQSRPDFSVSPTLWTTMQYDRLGQTLSVTTPDAATTTITPTLLATDTIDPEGHHRYVHRDWAGRVTESGNIVNGASYGAMHFDYGPFDKVERVTDAMGNKHTLVHDGFGRLVSDSDPDTGDAGFEYDGFGQLVSQDLANGDTITRTYDALGRIIDTTTPEGTTSHLYDIGLGAAGKLVRISSPDTTTAIGYDAHGRTHSIAQTLDGVTRTVEHRYDTAGRLLYLFYPDVAGFDRPAIRYTWSSDGLIHELRDVSACHVPTGQDDPVPNCTGSLVWQASSRDAALRLTQATFGNASSEFVTYNNATGKVTQISAPGSSTGYGYDFDGRVISRTDLQTGRAEQFSYDDLHRLTGWKVHGGKDMKSPTDMAVDYDYDELGNLETVVEDGNTSFKATYGAQGRPHEMDWSSTGGTYGYDDAGRQISGGGRDIAWNDFDQPVKLTDHNGTSTYRYDGGGGRASRDNADENVTYIGRLFEHHVATGGATRDSVFVYGDPDLVAQIDYAAGTKTTRYTVSDPLASIVDVLGTPGEKAYFDPFGGRVDGNGKPTVDPDTTTSRGFGGHEEDGDDLVNMQGRIYDRAQFRFLSPDPVISDPLFGQSHNPYSYVLNDPLDLSDPTGFEGEGEGEGGADYDPTPVHDTPASGQHVVSEHDGYQVIDVDTTQIHGGGRRPPVGTDQPKSQGIPNIVKMEAYKAPTPAIDRVRLGLDVLRDSRASFLARATAGVVSLLSLSGAKDEMVQNIIVEIPQAPVISFDAYEQHNERAMKLEAIGADSAADMEYLGQFQELSMFTSETAGLFGMFSPGGAPTEALEAGTPEAESAVNWLVDRIAEEGDAAPKAVDTWSQLARDTSVDAEEVLQWRAKANANSYKSTAQQFLYVITSKDGVVLKYGTTKWQNVVLRYGSKFEEIFGEGATIEKIGEGDTRTVRFWERELIKRYEWMNGSRPPMNKAYH